MQSAQTSVVTVRMLVLEGNAIHDAKTSVLVQAYSFPSSPIAKALVSAKRHVRGIRIVGMPASTTLDGRGAYRFSTYTDHGDVGRRACRLASVALGVE